MKQYLITVDEAGMRRLQLLLGRDIGFLEVSGMDITGNTSYRILATPIAPPLEAADQK